MGTVKFTKSIYTKMIVQLIAFIIVPFLTTIVLLITLVEKDNLKSRYQTNIKVAEQIESNVMNNIELTQKIIATMLSSGELINFISKNYEQTTDYIQYDTTIRNYITATIATDYRSNIRIYTDNSTLPMGMGVLYPLDKIENDLTVSSFINSNNKGIWLSQADFKGNNRNLYIFPTTDCFIYLEKIYNHVGSFIGVITFSIPEKYFFSYDEKNNVISSGNMRILNFTDKKFTAEDIKEIEKTTDLYTEYHGILLYRKEIGELPFNIIIATSSGSTYIVWRVFTILMLTFFIAAAFLLVRNIRHMVYKMNVCINEMDKSISGGFVDRIDEVGDDELTQIAKKINVLLDNIVRLLALTVKRETASKEAQLMALKHQINPHFIYNTMEVFSSKMKLYQHYRESDAMVAFANIFRYNASTKEDIVTVEEEISQVLNYLEIQKLRYPNIKLEVNISNDIASMKMPKFIFQPLIENSIVHGNKGKAEELKIIISAEHIPQTNTILFSVADNGEGISSDELEIINKRFCEKMTDAKMTTDSSIGIYNINARLRLYYGEEYHLTIYSKENNWTLVSFSIALY